MKIKTVKRIHSRCIFCSANFSVCLTLYENQAMCPNCHRLNYIDIDWNDNTINKEYKIIECENIYCKQKLRIPNNRYKIAVTCPKCKYKFVKYLENTVDNNINAVMSEEYFFECVKNSSKNIKLNIDNVLKQFKDIGLVTENIKLGINGAKEFVAAILFGLFCDKQKERGGNIHDIFNMIFIGLINVADKKWGPTEFSNHLDAIIYKTKIIPYEEWSKVYRYLRDNHKWIEKELYARENIIL